MQETTHATAHEIRGILFDKDGTLFDFRKTWLPILLAAAEHIAGDDQALAKALAKAGGYDPDSDRFDASGPIAAGNAEDMADAWRDVLLRYGWADAETHSESTDGKRLVTPKRAELVAQIDTASRETGVTTSVPVTDLYVLFSRLHASGRILGLATSDSEEAAHASLRREGIETFFSVVTGYDSPGAAKPSAEVVYTFCRRTGVRRQNVCVVGDTWHDIEMAKAAGARSIAVLTGAVERESLEPYADIVLPSIAELPEYLGID
ncbi:MAG: HAD family hydrolase [Spirochaetales bacterium]